MSTSEAATHAGDFDFGRFIERRKRAELGNDETTRYAFSADVQALRQIRKIRPLENAASAIVRMNKELMKNQYLGTTVRVSEKQFPSLYAIAKHCADTLGVPVPTMYVTNHPQMNAYTFGTNEDSFIVLHSSLIDHFSEDELRFVIGHETGHIQNKHVVYGTLMQILKNGLGLYFQILVPPVELALNTWYRAAEVTCDRAGLLCCRDPRAAERSFVKLACGSQKLYAELDVEEFLGQLEEGRAGLGRFGEAFASHPYLPKRVQALRIFEQSKLFREQAGLEGGLSIEEVDVRTVEAVQIAKETPSQA